MVSCKGSLALSQGSHLLSKPCPKTSIMTSCTAVPLPSQEDHPMFPCESHWVACLRSICRRIHFSRSLPQRHLAHNISSSDERKKTAGTSNARAVSAPFATMDALLVTEAFVSPLPKNFSIPSEDLACEENASRHAPQTCYDLGDLAPDATFAGTCTVTRGHDLAFRLQLDRVLVRVGARVPWGRLHRGRFAKVGFT